MKLRTFSRLLIAGVIAAGILVGAWISLQPTAAVNAPVPLDVTSLSTVAPNFTLDDQNGRSTSLGQFRGHEVILTFMYTHCPDTCPLTAQKLRTILHHLGAEGRGVSVLIVSTDPFGDSRSTAKRFLRAHGLARWRFLLGSEKSLSKVWKSYGVYAGTAGSTSSKTPTHTAVMYFISSSGQEQGLMEDLVPGNIIQQDLHIFLRDRHWLASLPVAAAVGARAPSFDLPSLTGSTLRLAQFRGKPLVLNFWATYCVPCRTEMPLLQRTYLQHPGRFALVGIDEQEPNGEVASYTRSVHVSYPIGLDRNGDTFYRYGLAVTPTTYFIDRSGVVIGIRRGPLTPNLLHTEIDQISGSASMMAPSSHM